MLNNPSLTVYKHKKIVSTMNHMRFIIIFGGDVPCATLLFAVLAFTDLLWVFFFRTVSPTGTHDGKRQRWFCDCMMMWQIFNKCFDFLDQSTYAKHFKLKFLCHHKSASKTCICIPFAGCAYMHFTISSLTKE